MSDTKSDTVYQICHIAGGGDRGGAKTHILTLLERMDPELFAITLICLNEGTLARQAREKGLDVKVFSMAGHWDMSIILRLARFLKKHRPDLVHTHGVRANLCGRSAAKLANNHPVITTIHSLVTKDYPTNLANWFYAAVDRITMPWADYLICVSARLKDYVVKKGFPREKVEVIGNGIDLAPFEKLDEVDRKNIREEFQIRSEDKVVGTVGRLVPIKGYDVFLKAAQKMALQNDSIRFLVVGEGPSEKELKALARRYKIEEKVIFAGYRKDIPELFKAMDVFVISSYSEGGPIVLLEAMASGVPVVSTRVGGIPEVIEDGQTGLLVPPGKEEELAEKIMKLLKQPDLRRSIQEKALKKVRQEFTTDRAVEKTQALYLRLLEEKHEK